MKPNYQRVGNSKDFYKPIYHRKIEVFEQSYMDIAQILCTKLYNYHLQRRMFLLSNEINPIYKKDVSVPTNLISDRLHFLLSVKKERGKQLKKLCNEIRGYLSFSHNFHRKNGEMVSLEDIVKSYDMYINKASRKEIIDFLS